MRIRAPLMIQDPDIAVMDIGRQVEEWRASTRITTWTGR